MDRSKIILYYPCDPVVQIGIESIRLIDSLKLWTAAMFLVLSQPLLQKVDGGDGTDQRGQDSMMSNLKQDQIENIENKKETANRLSHTCCAYRGIFDVCE